MKSRKFDIRMPFEMYLKLKKKARIEGTTMTSIVLEAIETKLKQDCQDKNL